MEKVRKFFAEDRVGIQIYSFVKTYFVVFLGIYLFGINTENKDAFDVVFIVEAAKSAWVSVIRNIWKLITE